MTTRYGIDKPHLTWSRYWGAWMASFNGLQRIGDTPSKAYDVLGYALLMRKLR